MSRLPPGPRDVLRIAKHATRSGAAGEDRSGRWLPFVRVVLLPSLCELASGPNADWRPIRWIWRQAHQCLSADPRRRVDRGRSQGEEGQGRRRDACDEGRGRERPVPGGGVALLRAKAAIGKLSDENADIQSGINLVLRAIEAPIRSRLADTGLSGFLKNRANDCAPPLNRRSPNLASLFYLSVDCRRAWVRGARRPIVVTQRGEMIAPLP